ncbi:MAG TPA: LysR substrate-binding domain-containing protein [Acidimicrobiales bacterium]|nr:LysR substrate-binding domain-containing protein [Acidimicrobiales bacterium]
MDARQLNAVLAVVDTGSFTTAADELHVSQPALSQTVRVLEAELGTLLFHRLGRRVVLTAAGEALVPAARSVVRGIETARARVAAVVGLAHGYLDVVALPTLAVEPTARLVGGFREAHPGITVRLAEPEDTREVMAMLTDGRAELGIADHETAGAGAPDGLVAIRLGKDEFSAVCPPGTTFGRARRLAPHHLAGTPLVVTPPGTSTRRLADRAFEGSGIEPVIAVETAQREALLPLVLAGAGTTFLPSPLAEAARRQGAAVFELVPRLVRGIALFHRDGPLSPAAAAFVELARRRPASPTTRFS